MSETKWTRSSSPLRARERVFRLVHAIRAGVRSAGIDWKSIDTSPREQSLSGRVTFHVVVEPDPIDQGFIARCDDLPGCWSQGDTEAEAAQNLVEAITGVVEARMQRHLRSHPLTPAARHDDESDAHESRTLELPVA